MKRPPWSTGGPRRPANHLVTHQRYEAKAPARARARSSWAVAKGDFVRGSCRLVLDASLARGGGSRGGGLGLWAGDPAAVATLKGKELWERAARIGVEPSGAALEQFSGGWPVVRREKAMVRRP